jgi:hypothetical protein
MLMEGSGSVQIITDRNPKDPKSYGSGTLLLISVVDSDEVGSRTFKPGRILIQNNCAGSGSNLFEKKNMYNFCFFSSKLSYPSLKTYIFQQQSHDVLKICQFFSWPGLH